MGSSQSARKLTISNEEEVGVIKVSNAIIQRLAQSEKATGGESPPTSEDHRQQRATPPPPPPPLPAAPPSPSVAAPVAPPTPGAAVFYYPELTMSAHHVQQQKEQELRQQDEYWRKRLQNLDESYQRINRVLDEEYKKASSETTGAKAGRRVDIQDAVQPCLENSNKVLKCYQDHPKETLRCSSLVEEFSNCVWNVHYTRVLEARS